MPTKLHRKKEGIWDKECLKMRLRNIWMVPNSPTGETLSSQETDLEDIVIVKRETQVVRAVEPRTGSEKWNFSVSTHHLTFQPGKKEMHLHKMSTHNFRFQSRFEF